MCIFAILQGRRKKIHKIFYKAFSNILIFLHCDAF
uniref:Uncharacterized protein n=1 Tax=Arundo donax TaxID=35708 RepID=A0A0A9U073_ARUDO